MRCSQFPSFVSQAAQPKALVYRGVSYDPQTTEVDRSDSISTTDQSAETLYYRGVSYLSSLHTSTLPTTIAFTKMMYRGCAYSISG